MTKARQEFIEAQRRMLDRYGVEAESRFFEVRSLGGHAHALICGEGPAVLMLNGIGTPAAMWAPLMAQLAGFRLLLATERLPGFRHTFLSMLNVLLRLRGNRPETRLTAKQLAQIEQPTLVFWGENDPFGRVEIGERMVEVMPNAELHVVGGGHAPWVTQSERIGPIATRFLREHV